MADPLPQTRTRSVGCVRIARSCRWATALLLALSGCGDAPAAMEVGGVGFTEEELLGLTPSRRAALRDLTALALSVDRQEVDALGAPLRANERTDRLWQQLQVEEILRDQGVGDDVLRARYSANPEYELTVRHLIVLSPRYEGATTRAEARGKAERALERILGGEPFPAVAAEVSEEPGAEGRQGLLEPGRRGAWVDEFWSAASALEVGEISPVVETQYGFHVLRLEDRAAVPFSEVRARVAADAAALITALEPDADRAPLPEGVELTPDLNALSEETAVVASFSGGQVTLSDLLDHAATLDPASWEAVRSGSDESRLEILDTVLRRAAVRVRAAAEGLEVDPAWEAATREGWHGRVQQWAEVLGFRSGMGDAGAKTAALQALSATGQMPRIARDEIRAIRGLLERRFGSMD